jgi:hypothetical protein
MWTKESRLGVAAGLSALAALTVAVVLLAMPTPAHAQVNCATATTAADTDRDGFSDRIECDGFSTFGTVTLNFPRCGPNAIRATCVDPSSPDLFVILVTASPSRIPPDPLVLLSRPRNEGGLGLATHQLAAANAGTGANDRRVTAGSPQKAVRITENLNPTGIVLGQATFGTPNGLDRAIVYTQRIADHVNSVYAAAGLPTPAGVIDAYIRHTIAHECAHTLGGLTTAYDSSLGGHHYPPGTNVVMEQAVVHDVVDAQIVFGISERFTAVDQGAVNFK